MRLSRSTARLLHTDVWCGVHRQVHVGRPVMPSSSVQLPSPSRAFLRWRMLKEGSETGLVRHQQTSGAGCSWCEYRLTFSGCVAAGVNDLCDNGVAKKIMKNASSTTPKAWCSQCAKVSQPFSAPADPVPMRSRPNTIVTSAAAAGRHRSTCKRPAAPTAWPGTRMTWRPRRWA